MYCVQHNNPCTISLFSLQECVSVFCSVSTGISIDSSVMSSKAGCTVEVFNNMNSCNATRVELMITFINCLCFSGPSDVCVSTSTVTHPGLGLTDTWQLASLSSLCLWITSSPSSSRMPWGNFISSMRIYTPDCKYLKFHISCFFLRLLYIQFEMMWNYIKVSSHSLNMSMLTSILKEVCELTQSGTKLQYKHTC